MREKSWWYQTIFVRTLGTMKSCSAKSLSINGLGRLSSCKGIDISYEGELWCWTQSLITSQFTSCNSIKRLKVLQEITKYQQNFLWGGLERRKRINWFSWSNICKSKEDGGLCVKNIEAFNMVLVWKWKWWILIEKDALWAGVIKQRYNNV